ncbi:MAG: hypothetical protein ACE366_21285 [Bradymonadia bacterium]
MNWNCLGIIGVLALASPSQAQSPLTEVPAHGPGGLLEGVSGGAPSSGSFAAPRTSRGPEDGRRGRGLVELPELPEKPREKPAETPIDFSSEVWCEDSGTVCWSEDAWMPGIRFLVEPQLGFVSQFGDNSFSNSRLLSTASFGVSLAIFEGWAGIQLLYIPEHVNDLDDDSQLVKEARKPVDPSNPNSPAVAPDFDGSLKVDFGVAAGVWLFDGVVVLGAGFLNYDTGRLPEPLRAGAAEDDGFLYMAIQPASTLRAIIKRLK